MERKFTSLLRDPVNGEELQLLEITTDLDNVKEGVLINKSQTSIYPVSGGVAILLLDAMPSHFYKQHETFINSLKSKYPNLKIAISEKEASWSFSSEWEYHTVDNLEKTWGLTLDHRYKTFLAETMVEESQLKGMLMLDAGCGNGLHTENLSTKGATIVGIDFSTSVFDAEKRRKSKDVLFVRGDLMHPPFANGTFDIIISNGVIHHTPNTYTTFVAISKLPKINGKLYLWLYSKQGGLGWRFKRSFFDFLRVIVCRFSPAMQNMAVNIVTFFLYNVRKLLGKKDDIRDMKLDMYDSITPRWRHYHQPFEVWYWYVNNGFANPAITSWETLYGYGILGRRIK